MAHHKSAIKRIRQNEKRRLRNKHVKSTMRGRIRLVREAVAAGDKATAQTRLREAISHLGRAASKGVIRPRKAARLTSRLSRLVNTLD